MDIEGTFKRVPKWAWVAGGGVGAGIVGLRLIRSRKSDPVTTDSEGGAIDPSAPANAGYGSGATSVIVPPVVQQGTTSDGTGGLLSEYINGVDLLFSQYGTFAGTISGLIAGQQDATLSAVHAGADITQQGADSSQAGMSQAVSSYTELLTQMQTGGGASTGGATGVVTAPAQPQTATPASKHPGQNASFPLWDDEVSASGKVNNLPYRNVCKKKADNEGPAGLYRYYSQDGGKSTTYKRYMGVKC